MKKEEKIEKFNSFKRLMGNARFFVARSCFTLENHRLACKVMGVGREFRFEEKKFMRIEIKRGTKLWYLGDNLHRRDGPAIEWVDGSKVWYFEGKKHRVDGPAFEYTDGYKVWYFEGKKHRVDGPAVEWIDGRTEWWDDGELIRVVVDKVKMGIFWSD